MARHRIRRATVAEAQLLSDLAMRSKAHWGYDDAFMEACRAELTVTPETIRAGGVYVCERADGSIAGFFDVRPQGGVAEVYDVFVDPDAIGEGVGRQLWQRLEQRVVELGLDTICVDADPNAVGYYEHMGARVVGEAPSGSIPGRMLPRLAKRLDGTSA